MSWQQRSSREIYRNAWISVREDAVVRPDGVPGTYGVVTVNRPAVFVVPVTEAGEVIMIRQRRYTTGVDSLEVPGGGVDDDEPRVAAERELREETGYAAGSWRDLGPVYSLNGVADAPGRVFLATDLTSVGGDEREVEGISAVVALPFAELLARIGRGEVTDNETLAALLLALVALDRVRGA
ncbi:NUDIX domain-containing protein [Microlunatus sp. GCM10028923]|uniref:NUDIX domain-containing protein n=1 Tax=Microlunatus sp. GCM10028923 TaxID=3273400 RepID=UPI003609FFFF